MNTGRSKLRTEGTGRDREVKDSIKKTENVGLNQIVIPCNHNFKS